MTITLNIPSDQLARGLAAVMPHAATASASLPMLQTVRLEVVDGALFLIATDRYTVGTYRITGDVPFPEFTALLELDDAKRIAKQAGGLQRATATYPSIVTLDEGSFECNTLGSSIRVRVADYSFPAWRTIFESSAENIAKADVADKVRTFGPAQLAKFTKAGDKFDGLVLHSAGATKVTIITVGEQFVGAIMPHRMATVPELPEWITAPHTAAARVPLAS